MSPIDCVLMSNRGIVSGYVLLIKELGVNEHIYFAAESECKSTVYKENIDQSIVNHESWWFL